MTNVTTFSTSFASLSADSQAQAVADYNLFFSLHPTQKNPTDLNTNEKCDFFEAIGRPRFAAMQAARKASSRLNLTFTKVGG